MPDIDLQPFCSTDEVRPYLWKPFNRGEFTYATNGHVAVCVPKRDGIEDESGGDKVPHAERVFSADYSALAFRPFRGAELPDLDCEKCDGIGAAGHDCPSCQCDCSTCHGSGRALVSVSVGGVPFNGKYISLIQMLPGLRVPETTVAREGMPFVFEGGQGMLMPLSDPHETHVEEKP